MSVTTMHVRDDLYFTRNDDGSVRVRKFSPGLQSFPRDETPGDILDITIDPMTWCSVVTSMMHPSRKIEELFYDGIRKFHLEPKS